MKHLKLKPFIAFALLLGACTKAEIPANTTPINRTVSYQSDIKTIVQNNCLTCHSAVNSAAGLSLETYQQVKNSAENGTLIQRINDAANPMPQSGLLPADTRALFDKWVTDGYLEQ